MAGHKKALVKKIYSQCFKTTNYTRIVYQDENICLIVR